MDHRAVPSESPQLCALVIAGEKFETHPLPASGELTVGSGATCHIRIENTTIAPLHAVLHVGATVELEQKDLSCETRVRESRLSSGDRAVLNPGEAVQLGAVLLVIQRRSSPPLRRIWTHGYFEARVEEECLRAERTHTQFAVLRVACLSPNVSAAIEDTLANVLRILDIVANYGAGEYEVLLGDTNPEHAELVAQRLTAKLKERGVDAHVGMACFPRNARSADALMAEAGAAAHQGVFPPAEAGAFLPPVGSKMQDLHKLVDRIAASTINVLVLGETGAGKEILAERVHRASARAEQHFLRLNCAALSESLVESELFGFEKGAFTGATQSKPGLLESCDGGTVFLDEIGELPMSTQVKLLRVIEERRVMRVGALRPRTIDVRFVSATNRDLEYQVSRGTFREDLYYRLNGISLFIPPLRDRVDEIEGLARTFITDICRRLGRAPPGLASEALGLLKRYSWPGNIRELRNVIERAVLLCGTGPITLAQLSVEKLSGTFAERRVKQVSVADPRTLRVAPDAPPPTLLAAVSAPPAAVAAPAVQLAAPVAPSLAPVERATDPKPGPNPVDLRLEAQRRLEQLEREQILSALSACGGNQTETAKLLGISRRTLVNRLDGYGVPRPRKQRSFT